VRRRLFGTGYASEVLADSPAGFWRLSETTGTAAVDASGFGLTGTYVNSPTLGVAGPIATESPARAVSFNGTSQKITLPKFTTPKTVEAWVKLSTNTGTLPVLSNRDYWSGSMIFFGVSAGKAFAYVNSRSPAPLSGTSRIDDGAWHQIAYTWDGSTGKIYVDGVLQTSAAQTDTALPYTQVGNIGFDTPNGSYFPGSLADVSIYGSVLPATRIAAHYTAATTIVAPSNVSPPAASGSAQVGGTLTAGNGTWSGPPSSYAYQWRRCAADGSSCADVAGTGQSYVVTAGDLGSSLRVVVTGTNALGSASATSLQTAVIMDTYRNVILADQPSAYWRFDETNGTTAADSSGNGLDATYSSGITLGSSGGLTNDPDSAATFTTSASVSRSIVTTQTSGVTMEAWIYWTDTSARSNFLYNGTGASNGYGLYISNGACGFANQIYVLLGGSLCNGIGSGGVIPTNQWTYVALTLGTNQTFTLYVNGVAKKSGTANFVAPTGTTSVGNGFAGKVDEVAIYNTTLSSSQIFKHYQAGLSGPWPVQTTPPTISGTTAQGWTLSESEGNWTGSPTFAVQWQRCDAAGACTDIGGAIGPSYTLTADDAGKTIRVKVTASNSGGSAVATSAPTAVIAPLTKIMPPPPSASYALRSLAGHTSQRRAALLCPTPAQDYNGPWIAAYRWNCVTDANGVTYYRLEVLRRTLGGNLENWYYQINRCDPLPTWPWNTCGNDSQSYDGIGGAYSFALEYWKEFGPTGAQSAGKLVKLDCSTECYWTTVQATATPPEITRGRCPGGPYAAMATPFASYSANPSACDGDPVNGATGGLRYAATDLVLPGRGMPFVVARSYNSEDRTSGNLGPGWSVSYGASLTIQPTGDAILRSDDGQRIDLYLQSGAYVGRGFTGSFTAVAGGYELTGRDQRVSHFNAQGVLQWVQDRNGNRITLGYDAAGHLSTFTDTVGRTINVQTNAAGQITSVTVPDGRSVSYHYTNGQLTSVTDVRGGTTSYTYDDRNRLASIVDANNHTALQTVYNAAGRVTSQTDANGKQTTFNWDDSTGTLTVTDARNNTWTEVYSGNELVKRIDPLGNTTTYGYDANYNLTTVTDPRGNATPATYDSHGNLLTVTAPAPLSYQQTFAYNSRNDVTSVTDGRNNATSYGYDSVGNLTSITRPGGSTIQFNRGSGGVLASVTNALSKTTTLAHDANGNLTTITSPLGAITTLSYDGAGRPTSVVEPRGNVSGANPDDYKVTYTYDAAGDVLTATDPLDHTTRWTYDAVGNVISQTDANGHVTSYAYDPANRLSTVTAPGGATTTYGYDNIGNVVSKQDANGHTTSYAYDAANRLTSVTTANNKLWTFAYDANGNLTSVVDAKANAANDPTLGTTTYTYDVANRLTGIGYSDGTPGVSYGYDANGNRTAMTDGAGSVSYSYDALNRLTGTTRGSDSFGYGYNAVDELTERDYPNGAVVAYTYTDDGELATVTRGGATTTYTYDVAGEPVLATLPAANGYTETRVYDRAGRLSEIRNAKNGTTLSFADYLYDPVGNPTQITTTAGVSTLNYDNRDRLTEVCDQSSCPAASDPFVRYAYDPVGNRTSEARPTGTSTYSYDAADQLTSINGPSGTTSYAFDADGRETQAGSRAFVWNLAGEIASTSDGGASASYSYDGDGNRLSEAAGGTTTNFRWDVNYGLPQIAVERDGNGAELRSYLYGLGPVSMNEGGQSYYFHRDGLGSIVNLTDANGATQWSYSYEPYGTPKTATQNDPNAPVNQLRFTGEYLDGASGLINLRARQYDPTNGRFLSPDPIGADPLDSTYVYGNDNPAAFIDPSGLGAVWGEGSYGCEGHGWFANTIFDYSKCAVEDSSSNPCPDGASIWCWVKHGAPIDWEASEESLKGFFEGVTWGTTAVACYHVGKDAFAAGASAGAPTGEADPLIAVGAGLAGCAIAVTAEIQLHEKWHHR
jgi:RHS repeat-associated protein